MHNSFETMYTIHKCDWCKSEFISKRKHAIFCSVKCRVRSCRIRKDFVRIEELLPEAEAIAKYHVEQEMDCIVFLQWFRQKDGAGGYNRFADVYVSKEISAELIEKIKRKRNGLPIRYTR
jgi:hypothetical protein